jgi:hypothetical protein
MSKKQFKKVLLIVSAGSITGKFRTGLYGQSLYKYGHTGKKIIGYQLNTQRRVG